MNLPTRQKRWEQFAQGVPFDVIRIAEVDVLRPTPNSDDVLVQVKAVGFNQMWKVMGLVPAFIRQLPAALESNFSGVVVDPGESAFKVGDEVLGMIPPTPSPITSTKGCLAQYVLAKSIHIVRKPKEMSWESAAGLSSCGVTSYQAIFKYYDNYHPGQRVLVVGGSTSVGRTAIQIAKLSGGYVVASCSKASEAGVRELGADEIVNYETSPLHLQLAAKYSSNPFDLIIDSSGIDPNIFPYSPSYLKPTGKYVQPGGNPEDGVLVLLWRIFCNTLWPVWAGGVPRAYKFYSVKVGDTLSIQHELRALVKWVEEGKLRVDVDSVHGFDRQGVMSAYERIMSAKAKGKVVVRVS